MAQNNSKQVKLQPRYRESSTGQQIVPWLTVSGVWLQELGFMAGDTVRITTREKLLIKQLQTSRPWKYEYLASKHLMLQATSTAKTPAPA